MPEENVAASVAETVVEKAPETPTETRDYEAEARAGGWKPETEWKGDKKPAKFLTAEEFVQRGEEITPFIHKENKRLHERLDRQERDFARRVASLERVKEATLQRQQEDYQRELDRIKGEQVKAVEAGDTAEFKRLDAQRDKLKPPVEEAEPVADPEEDKARIEADWATKNNTWFGIDEDMTAIAVHFSQKLARESNNTISLDENLRRTEAHIRSKFPEQFGGRKTNGHAAVDGGGSFSSPSKSDPFTKLTAEERSVANSDMKNFPKIYPTKESWIRTYEGKK